MNCLTAKATRVGGSSLQASFIREFKATATRIGGFICNAIWGKTFTTSARFERDFTCRIGFVCSTSLGEEDVLWASDGMVFNVYGDKIYITVKS